LTLLQITYLSRLGKDIRSTITIPVAYGVPLPPLNVLRYSGKYISEYLPTIELGT
jgi:hypothetical protein